MGLSSNILWHQTTLDGLKGILKEQGFFYSYSLESILSRESKNNLNVAFPMVSLCDLPFSELSKAEQEYINYGVEQGYNKGYQFETSPKKLQPEYEPNEQNNPTKKVKTKKMLNNALHIILVVNLLIGSR